MRVIATTQLAIMPHQLLQRIRKESLAPAWHLLHGVKQQPRPCHNKLAGVMAQTVAPRTDIIRQRNAKFVCGFREELGSDGGLISCEIDAKELEASGLAHQPSTHACAIRHRREERAARATHGRHVDRWKRSL